MREYNAAVFIGRFQPFHNEHLAMLRQALELAEGVLVVIGSCNAPPTIKNPFSYAERVAMIRSCFGDDVQYRLQFIPVRDYYYSDNLWLAEVQRKISEYITATDHVALFGVYKDASSYYLNMFPDWDLITGNQKKFVNSTDIRERLFSRDVKLMDFNVYHPDTALRSLKCSTWNEDLPEAVADWLKDKYFVTQGYHERVQEHFFFKQYREEWGTGPFVTADAVVTCAGHLLVIKRKFLPGKGLYALPGGFVKLTERIEDGMLRELKEETGIQVPKAALKNQIRESKVFDYPNRSLRGRVITHAFHVELKGQPPAISAASDADNVQWMPLYDVFQNEQKFFEDHFQISSYFTMRG